LRAAPRPLTTATPTSVPLMSTLASLRRRGRDGFELELAEVLAGEQEVGAAQRGFHDATGRAEELARAAAFAQRRVRALGLEGIELQAAHADHARELAGGQDRVDVGAGLAFHLGALRLELLGRARHDRDDVDVFWILAEFLRPVALDDRAEHLLRALAAREVGDQVGIELLDELDPTRRAAGHHRQRAAALDALHELAALFHDREVGGEARVEDVVDAEATQGGDEHAVDVLAGADAELFGQRDRDRGCVLRDDGLVRVEQRVGDAVEVAAFAQCAGRADHDALPAVDAGRDVEALLECGADGRLGAAADEVDRADALDLFADPHAAAAEDALLGVAEQ
jgi:hypothetical protein